MPKNHNKAENKTKISTEIEKLYFAQNLPFQKLIRSFGNIRRICLGMKQDCGEGEVEVEVEGMMLAWRKSNIW